MNGQPAMDDWISGLYDALAHEPAVVRVVVASTRGSVPREPGASLIVSRNGQSGTIGGGHLEYQAIAIARAMLDASDAEPARVDRFVLGATLGQCCGGVVELAFDRYEAGDRVLVREALDARADGGAVVLVSAVSGSGQPRRRVHRPSIHDCECTELAKGAALAPAIAAALVANHGDIRARLVSDAASGTSWLVERIDEARTALWIFGAGHVGSALVRVIADLPFAITWIDSRDDAFAAPLPPNVTAVASGDPVADVKDAPTGSHFLVLTHSHDLDLELCRAILARNDVASLGLIGSASKAMRFRHRLAQGGTPQERIDAMRCPIGIAGIGDKRPAAIALAVAAELMVIVEAGRASSIVGGGVPADARLES